NKALRDRQRQAVIPFAFAGAMPLAFSAELDRQAARGRDMGMSCIHGIPLTISGILLRVMLAVTFFAACSADVRAQATSPLPRIEAFHLATAKVGRVTVHFVPTDREYAHQLATLSEAAAAYFERELGGRFPLHLAVLSPDDWFDPYGGSGSVPYGMPWGSVEDL